MQLYLVRHGSTALNAQGRFQGSLDGSLSLEGQAEAEALGQRLAAELGPEGPDAIVSSGQRRADETASILASHLGNRSVETDVGLREIGLGAFEGRRPDELPRRDLTAWTQDGVACPVDGENPESFRARVRSSMRELAGKGSRIVAVTHGGPLAVVLADVLGVTPTQAARMVPPNAALVVVETDPDWLSPHLLQRDPRS